jgi:serine/threonine-protein kinase RsbW
MTQARFWMAFAADLQLVRLAAAALQGILHHLECEAQQAAMIELCVVEALNNAIEHAYAHDPLGRVELQLDIAADTLDIKVIDTGLAMPDGVIERARAGCGDAPGELREGGYGLGIILESMTNVEYRRVDDRNTLIMTITLSKRSA